MLKVFYTLVGPKNLTYLLLFAFLMLSSQYVIHEG